MKLNYNEEQEMQDNSFNRTRLELKQAEVMFLKVTGQTFNRTRLELKPGVRSMRHTVCSAFNRTRLELKLLIAEAHVVADQLLIVPDWN